MKVSVNYESVKDYKTRVNLYPQKCFTALRNYSELSSKSLESKARKQAKWTDRTGQARKSITGSSEQIDSLFTISLEGYAVDDKNREYFQYLELYHNKKYAILYPTLEKNKDNVIKGYSRVLSKVKL